ncbi:ATP-binding cassette domain-containing protein [Campylobacterota bacterium DY0563]
MDTNDTVLKIENLSFGYDKNRLIYENFNLELKRGKLISIVGSSGSGKSTLFELVSKNLMPLNGTINVKKISSIYQDPYSSFHPSFSIIEQIDDVINFDKKILEKEIEKNIKLLNLHKKFLYKRPHELSGGQLQRCSILRALLMKPDLLLVDEATSALDNIVAVDVMKLIVEQLNNCGILLITHDMSLAKWCSDELIDLNKITEK